MPGLIAICILFIYWFSQPAVLASFNVKHFLVAEVIEGKVQTVFIPEKHIPLRGETKTPKIAAAAFAAYDQNSGFVLQGQGADESRSIASITKLMTVLVFLDHNPGWGKEVTISRADYRVGAHFNLFVGETVTAGDLFRIGLVASDNVAIAALVRSTGMSEVDFVKEMNLKAQSLPLKQTHFTEPTGLKASNTASAHDVALLAATAFKEAAISETVTRSSYTFTTMEGKTKTIQSTDKLLAADLGTGISLEAGKTGHLDEAGFCFVGQFNKEGHIITTVVLGAETETARFEETKKLAEWVYNVYTW